jgi:LDH2 family malate/lactate/ureidoglycolate dehydrogenase
VLTGAGITHEVRSWMLDPPEPARQGHAFLAIDVGAIMPLPLFQARMDRLIREIRSAPKAKGATRIYLPGEMEWERRAVALAEGIAPPPDVLANLRGVAEEWDVDPAAFSLPL